MNRRTFLKSIVTACGAIVVCSGELLKSPIKYLWVQGKDGSYIEGIICKARQQGITTSLTYCGVPIFYRSPLYDEPHQT